MSKRPREEDQGRGGRIQPTRIKLEFQEQACESCVTTACVNAVQFLAGHKVEDVTTIDNLNKFLAKHGLYKTAGEGIDGNVTQDYCWKLINAMMQKTYDTDKVLLSDKYEFVKAKPSDLDQQHRKLSEHSQWGIFAADPIDYGLEAFKWSTTADRKAGEFLDEFNFKWHDNAQSIGEPYDIDVRARVALLDCTYKYDEVLSEEGHVVIALWITDDELDTYSSMIEKGQPEHIREIPAWYLLDSNYPERLMHLYFDITQTSAFEPENPLLSGERNVTYYLKPPFAFIQLKKNPSGGGRVAGGSGPVSGGASIAALLAGLAVTAVSSMVGASSVAP